MERFWNTWRLASVALLSLVLFACGSDTDSSSDEEDIEEEEIVLGEVPDGYLFFRDDDSGHLKYIPFMGSIADSGFTLVDSEAVDLNMGLDCYHPEVSPDGKWVAFSTSYENSGAVSELYVKRIGGTRRPKKLDVASAAIPRWRVLPNGDTVIVYVDDTRVLPSKNIEGDDSEVQRRYEIWKTKGTWMVPFKGGSFGKPKKIASGTFNGGVSDDLTFMVNGAALLMGRHIVYAKDGGVESTHDSIWFDRDQTCNASLSKDGTNRTLFLDMSGAQGIEFAGENYRPHHRILVVDEYGTLIDAVPSPDTSAYDHTEWVGFEDYVVGTLQIGEMTHAKIVLVNMRDSSIVNLVNGGEYWHPNLWVKQ